MEINGKVYRNLPQQVLKNQEDILALQGKTVDAYTKAESDAKFETKEVHQADFNALSSETDTLNQQMATANTDIENLKKVSGTQSTAISTLQADIERIDPIVPTDIAVHEGKLGLKHDTVWLTNQKAITLGTHLTYDAVTNTLDAVSGGGGATLPAGTEADPFILNNIRVYNNSKVVTLDTDETLSIAIKESTSYMPSISISTIASTKLTLLISGGLSSSVIYMNPSHKSGNLDCCIISRYSDGLVYHKGEAFDIVNLPDNDGTYNLQLTKNEGQYNYEWVASSTSKKTYNHYIVISDGTASNAIYLLIPSTNNLICNSLPELNTLLGTATRFIQASGVVTDTSSKLPIVAINWQGSFSSSKIVTMSSEEATTKFTNITDVVEPA